MKTHIILQHYLICALWAEVDDNKQPFEDNYSIFDFSREAQNKALLAIKHFISKAGNLLEGLTEETIGHNLWLTRNGYGTGFWDRGLEVRGEKLSRICEDMGSCSLYKWIDEIFIKG